MAVDFELKAAMAVKGARWVNQVVPSAAEVLGDQAGRDWEVARKVEGVVATAA
jgi:hypothetical protein